jgi:hypothetical protein
MARLSRLQISKTDIVDTFANRQRVLRARDIAIVLNQNRDSWRLAQSTSLREFIAFLVSKTELLPVRFPFPQRELIGYTWGKVPLLETLVGLVDRGFYSHYTALRIHGLTEQVPKTIYLNQEKPPSSGFGHDEDAVYEQDAIDQAFKKLPRITKNEIDLPTEQCRVVMLQSAYHEGLGVIDGTFNDGSERRLPIRYTDLERTMIDIVTRPFYAGGVAEVAKAFDNAKDKLVVNKMSAMLKKMEFGYPYHQAIGYYLERAGYKASLLDIFRRKPMVRDFYLMHGLDKTTYCREWRLHVPESF